MSVAGDNVGAGFTSVSITDISSSSDTSNSVILWLLFVIRVVDVWISVTSF